MGEGAEPGEGGGPGPGEGLMGRGYGRKFCLAVDRMRNQRKFPDVEGRSAYM